MSDVAPLGGSWNPNRPRKSVGRGVEEAGLFFCLLVTGASDAAEVGVVAFESAEASASPTAGADVLEVVDGLSLERDLEGGGCCCPARNSSVMSAWSLRVCSVELTGRPPKGPPRP